jgi:hypothetical protein
MNTIKNLKQGIEWFTISTFKNAVSMAYYINKKDDYMSECCYKELENDCSTVKHLKKCLIQRKKECKKSLTKIY